MLRELQREGRRRKAVAQAVLRAGCQRRPRAAALRSGVTFRHDAVAGDHRRARRAAPGHGVRDRVRSDAAGGIYCAMVTGFCISALGGSRVQIGGPTGAFVVVVSGIVAKHGVSGLFMCTMMAGVMLMLLGVTKSGSAVQFIPRPVVIGFTNGIAVLIASTQIRDFLGLRMAENPGEFIRRIAAVARHICRPSRLRPRAGAWRRWSLVIGDQSFVKAVPGTLVGLVAGTAAAWTLQLPVETVASRFGGVPSGLPAFQRSGVPPVADSDAALAGGYGRDARRDRIADVRGRRRSHERRPAQPERRARGAGHRERRVADVRRAARDGRDRADGDEHPLGRAHARRRHDPRADAARDPARRRPPRGPHPARRARGDPLRRRLQHGRVARDSGGCCGRRRPTSASGS